MKTEAEKKQMELTLEMRANRTRRSKKPKRRANWWFTQMRRAVDRAIDWSPQQPPPAHQVYFSMDQRSPNW